MKLITTRAFYETPQPELPWIIDPFAVQGSTILLYGRQGIGKSSLAWQLAHAIASGTSWLGHPIHRSGPVVYLNLDMPHLEFRLMLNRGVDAKLPPTNDILMPDVGDTETFDILRHGQSFIDSCAAHQPRALIVDTVSDAFMPGGSNRDINSEVRVVIGQFKRAVPHGLLLLLLHDRKKSAYTSLEANENDLDAFLGPTAWEAKATSSLRITASTHGVRLLVRKCRLDAAPYESLVLTRTAHGFFSVKRTFLHALHTWAEPTTNLSEVFRQIAEEFGEQPETVRQAYYRATKKGIVFAWSQPLVTVVTPTFSGASMSQVQVPTPQQLNPVTGVL